MKIVLDRGKEFMAEFSKMVKNDFGIEPKSITTRNLQENAIIERVYHTIENILRTFNVKDIDEEDP